MTRDRREEPGAENVLTVDLPASADWAVVEAMPDAILVVGADGVVVYANRRLQELTGWEPSEVVGKPLDVLVPPRAREAHRRLVQGYFADPVARQMGQVEDIVALKPDGSELPVDIALNAVRIGSDLFAVAAVRDDSARYGAQQELAYAEEALRQSDAMYRAVFEGSLDAVILGDDRARLLEMNPAAEELFGMTRAGALGQELFDMVTSRGQVETAWRDLLRQGHLEGQIEVVRPDGSRRIAEFAAKTNVLPGLHLAALRDVTERETAIEELRQSNAQLRSTDQERRTLFRRLLQAQEEERRRLAADIHDDSVQALTAMRLRLDLLRRQLVDEPEPATDPVEKVDQLASMAEGSIARLRRLIFELRPPALEREGLVGAIRTSAALLEETHDVRIDVRDLLASDPSLEVAAQVYRIAQEALSNVRRHASASRAEVSLEPDKGGILVSVEDDGIGFVLDAADAPGHAGLAGMRERAEMSGGWLRVDSAPGRGARVTFWLPAAQS